MAQEPRAVPEEQSRLTAYQVGPEVPPLRPGGPRRAWMDWLPERFAYRCLPLVIANQLGWDLVNPATFTACWNGGPHQQDLQITWGEGHWSGLPRSHFGFGILTFTVAYVFRTPPDVGLLVAGPPNWPKDGAHALSGLVETDWSPTTFTMNYQLTRPGHPVTFHAGEPFARLTPMPRHLTEGLLPEIRLASDAPDLERRYREWSQSRQRFMADSRVLFSEAADEGWQKEYSRAAPRWAATGPPTRRQCANASSWIDDLSSGVRPRPHPRPLSPARTRRKRRSNARGRRRNRTSRSWRPRLCCGI